MDLMVRRRELMGMQSVLPHEYKRVEWLGCDGSIWINTNIFTSTSVETEYNVKVGYWTVISGLRQLTGADYGAYFGINGSGVYEIGTALSIQASTTGFDVVHFRQDMENQKQILTVNGVEFTRAYSAWRSQRISIFNIQTVSANYVCRCRIKNLEVKQGGLIVGNFIPCIRKSDNKTGMYDTVSRAFYTNAGTGEFIVPN